MKFRKFRILAVLALIATMFVPGQAEGAVRTPCADPSLALTDGSFFNGTPALTAAPQCMAVVTSGEDSGTGTLRRALRIATVDSAVQHVLVQPGLRVVVNRGIGFYGSQEIHIHGNGSEVVGKRPAANISTTWNKGLIYTSGTNQASIRDMEFQGSFNNGVAFFPGDTNVDSLFVLQNVVVTNSRFHGIYVDGQHTPAYDSAGVVHVNCTDPFPSEGPGTIFVQIIDSSIVGSGNLPASYDDSIATGCPRDFDGVRIDEGAAGSLRFLLSGSDVTGNASDGIELDERDDGDAYAKIYETAIVGNGYSGNSSDLDDGLDIDETGPGDVTLLLGDVTVNANAAEGLDIDENDDGDLIVDALDLTVTSNGGDGVSIRERNNGSVNAEVQQAVVTDNEKDGLDIGETGNGSADVELTDIESSDNEKDGVQVTEEGDGSIVMALDQGDLVSNDNTGAIVIEEDAGSVDVTMTGVTATLNNDHGLYLGESGDGDLTVDLTNVQSSDNGLDGVEVNEAGDGSVTMIAQESDLISNDRDGARITETNAGWLDLTASDVVASENSMDGVRSSETGAGHLDVALGSLDAHANGGRGVASSEEADGSVNVGASDLVITSLTGAIDFELSETGAGSSNLVFATAALGNMSVTEGAVGDLTMDVQNTVTGMFIAIQENTGVGTFTSTNSVIGLELFQGVS